ncbi:MAG TPA: hypothetical protein VK116_15240, partial [Planctomycetota bacterium]|nr:hypothetical protein [Planctomycetota bacterium]
EAAANRGWVAIAADESVVTRRIEVEAIRRHKARILVPGLRKRPVRERAELFVLAVPQIRRFVTKEAPPWVARVVPARERSVKKPRVTRLQLPET